MPKSCKAAAAACSSTNRNNKPFSSIYSRQMLTFQLYAHLIAPSRNAKHLFLFACIIFFPILLKMHEIYELFQPNNIRYISSFFIYTETQASHLSSVYTTEHIFLYFEQCVSKIFSVYNAKHTRSIYEYETKNLCVLLQYFKCFQTRKTGER